MRGSAGIYSDSRNKTRNEMQFHFGPSGRKLDGEPQCAFLAAVTGREAQGRRQRLLIVEIFP